MERILSNSPKAFSEASVKHDERAEGPPGVRQLGANSIHGLPDDMSDSARKERITYSKSDLWSIAQHSQCVSIAGLSPAVTPQLSCFIHLLIFLSKFQKIKSVRWGFRITRPVISQVQNKIISY